MNNTNNKQWIILIGIAFILVTWAWLAGSRGNFEKTPTIPGIFLHLFVWMVLGTLFRLSSKDATVDILKDIGALVIGMIILVALWFLPTLIPSLKLSEYGVTLNLQMSPLILWVSVAFLLGYYRRTTVKIPVVAWNRIKKNLGFKEDADFKGNAKHRFTTLLEGLGQVIGIGNPK